MLILLPQNEELPALGGGAPHLHSGGMPPHQPAIQKEDFLFSLMIKHRLNPQRLFSMKAVSVKASRFCTEDYIINPWREDYYGLRLNGLEGAVG